MENRPNAPDLPPAQPSAPGLSPEQKAEETIMREASAVLGNLDQLIKTTGLHRRAVVAQPHDSKDNITVAFDRLLTELERARKEFFQSTYFAQDQQALF